MNYWFSFSRRKTAARKTAASVTVWLGNVLLMRSWTDCATTGQWWRSKPQVSRTRLSDPVSFALLGDLPKVGKMTLWFDNSILHSPFKLSYMPSVTENIIILYNIIFCLKIQDKSRGNNSFWCLKFKESFTFRWADWLIWIWGSHGRNSL